MSPILIRFGGYQKPASIHTRAAAYFGERLLARLGDRVRFELVGNVLDLGRPSGDLPVMVERGELTLCYISTVRFAEAVTELRILELPFVVPDRATAHRAFAGPLGGTFAARMAERTPLRMLGLWDNGFRHFTNRVRPIRRPEDCRGLRIRTQMSRLHGEALAALGFVPIAVDIKEFIEQIDGDVFDAQENPLTNTWNFNVHERHRHVTLSGHFFGAAAMVCNAAQYAAWPEDVREAVEAAACEATQAQLGFAAAEDDEILARVDPARNEIVRLTPEERQAFVDAVRPVVDRYRASIGERLFEYFA